MRIGLLLACTAALTAAFVAQPSRLPCKLCVKDPRERGNVDDEGPEIDSGMEYKKDATGRVTPAARTRADLKAETPSTHRGPGNSSVASHAGRDRRRGPRFEGRHRAGALGGLRSG